MITEEDGCTELEKEPDECPQCGGDVEWGSSDNSCETVQRNVSCTVCGCEWVSVFNFSCIVVCIDGSKE